MQVTVLGSGPACPRPGGASAGFLIKGPDGWVLVDCGHGVVSRMRLTIEVAQLSGILISHMHPDHFWDLVPLKYLVQWSNSERVPLHLPHGGADVLGRLQEAALGSDSFFTECFELKAYTSERTTEIAGLRVTFAPVRHPVEGYAMRFSDPEEPEHDVTYSADTAWTDEVVQLMQGASLAIVESSFLEYPEGGDTSGHLTASLAGKIAAEAGVTRLLLTHYGAWTGQECREAAQAQTTAAVELAQEGSSYLS